VARFWVGVPMAGWGSIVGGWVGGWSRVGSLSGLWDE
jgi:hypothetical protein